MPSFEPFGSSANPGSSVTHRCRSVKRTREGIRVRELVHQGERDVLGVRHSRSLHRPPRRLALTSGISTTTSPLTTAWQPRREWRVSPSAVSRRSSSSGSIGDRFSSPSRTMTWHVVQAQLPPQLCSRWMSLARAMSSSEPGRPWSASGYFVVVHLDGDVERQERHLVLRHHDDSRISSARREASASLRARVHHRLGQRLGGAGSARSSARGSGRGPRPRAPRAARRAPRAMRPAPRRSTRRAPWRSARSTWLITVSASVRASMSSRASTSASACVERLLHHALDLGLGEPVGRLHLDATPPSRCGARAPDLQDAVGVDQEGHLDLRHARRHRIDPRSSKRASERLSRASSRSPWSTWRSTTVWPSTEVVNISLAMVGIVVLRAMSTLTMPPERLDAERQRRHVQQQHVGDAAGQDLGLHRRAQRDHLVGVELAVGRPAEQLLHPPPHRAAPGSSRRRARPRRSGRRGARRRASAMPAGAERALHQRRDQRLDARPA